ncbi:MAG: DoxX family protein [Acidobacteria bacterium]|nr:DoxX family protein [Acidobacteriota bacterium]
MNSDAYTVFFLILAIIASLSAIYDFVGPAALKADVARWGYQPGFERVLGLIKLVGAWGLIIGMVAPKVGLLASAGFVVYFILALRTHKKVNDPQAKALPAMLLLGLSVACVVAGLMAP